MSVTRNARSRIVAVVAFLVALTPSCLGGQTGQPTSGKCQARDLPADETWHGSTAQALAREFEGAHHATLEWRTSEESGEAAPELSEEVSITIDAASATGTATSCELGLDVTVGVEVTTSESGLSQSGVGTLSFYEPDGLDRATLDFEGATLRVIANLMPTSAGESPQGTLTTTSAGAPGNSASFR